MGVRMSIGSDSQLTGGEPREQVRSNGSGEPARILLALDDDSVARAAVRVTSALARPRNTSVTVLRVIEVAAYCTAESFPELTNAEDLVLAADSSHSYRNELLRRVATLAGVDVDWHVVLELGNDARCIIRRSQAIDADLIVMGLEHHGLFARALAENTVRQVMASGVAPVLAVTRALETRPTRVVAGVDFTPSSIRAALLAGSLLDKHGSINLVYVIPASDSPSRSAEARVDEDFAELIMQFAPGTNVTGTRLYGRAADRLSAYAEEVGADLIAVGSHRYGLLERIRLGSVSAAVVRDARCSVLVAPPESAVVT